MYLLHLACFSIPPLGDFPRVLAQGAFPVVPEFLFSELCLVLFAGQWDGDRNVGGVRGAGGGAGGVWAGG